MQTMETQFRIRGIAILACAAGALIAQAATAEPCPPGYAPKGSGLCVPVPPHRYHPDRTLTAHSNVPSSVPLTHPMHKPSEINKEVDWRKVKPRPGVPIEHHSSASEKHGIIFVGGHSASRLDKTALNPQPIPPGHLKTPTPNPSA